MRLFKYFSISLILIILVVYARSNYGPYQTMSGKIFGTYYSIKIKTDNINNGLHHKVKQTLKAVNHQMSVFDALSEVSRINKSPAGQEIQLSLEMSFLLQAAFKVHQQSKGAFDPTVGKLVNLWGFGTDKLTKIPNQTQIDEALRHTGFTKLKFANNFKSLKKTDKDVYLDLSSIAKGYGVDKVAELLENEGYHDYIVEIGGEVRASGVKNDKKDGWSLGVAKPDEQGSDNALVVDISDYAVATSGDYRNFFYQDGRRYAHTISPQDGKPVEHNLASATVFHNSCMLADAYATAIMSLGEVSGLAMANRLNLPVILFVRNSDNSTTMLNSNAANALLEK